MGKLLDDITWPLLRSYLFMLEVLPLDVSTKILKPVMRIVLGRRMKVAVENVKLAFPSISEKGAEDLVKSSIDHLTRTVVEVLKLGRDTALRKSMEIRGIENLECVKKKGGIALSLHLGNFPLMCLSLKEKGFEIAPVIRKFKNRQLSSFTEGTLKRFGMKVIYNKPKKKATLEIIKLIKGGGMPFLAADQRAPGWEIKVPFFGVKVPTFRGPIILHKRTGAPVIPMYAFRDGRKNIGIIEKPMDEKLSGSIEEGLTEINRWMENVIKNHPESWFWFHRRWKRKE